MDVIDAKNIVKTFPLKRGKVKAVNNVSLRVRKGEIFGLLGVNGAGKSTLINILSGLTYPDSGVINLFGKDLYQHEEDCKKRFNVATPYYDLNRSITGRENLLVYAKLYGVKNPKEKIKALTDKFMLSSRLNIPTRHLSSGERTRLVIVKSLLNDPELLFLDECTVGLDPDMAEIARDHIIQFNKETKCTIIFTSHYMQEVERLCHRIAFMDQGKIVKIGTGKDLVQELNWQDVHLHFSKHIDRAKELLTAEHISFQQQQNYLVFQVQNRQNVLYPLLQKFVQKNIIFNDLQVNKPTLEDYFLRRSRKR